MAAFFYWPSKPEEVIPHNAAPPAFHIRIFLRRERQTRFTKANEGPPGYSLTQGINTMRRIIISKALRLVYTQAKRYVEETSTEFDNQVLAFLAKVINDFMEEEVIPVEERFGVSGERDEAAKAAVDGLHEICGEEQ